MELRNNTNYLPLILCGTDTDKKNLQRGLNDHYLSTVTLRQYVDKIQITKNLIISYMAEGTCKQGVASFLVSE